MAALPSSPLAHARRTPEIAPLGAVAVARLAAAATAVLVAAGLLGR
jgi:hypothetical protein